MKRALLIAGLAALASCEPPGPQVDPSEITTYLVYDYESESGEYEVDPREIETLNDPRTIDGDIAFLRGGGKVVSNVPDPQTADEYERSLVIEGDFEPSAEYLIDDGVAIPYDFDSQMMVTLYHHLERANEYFGSVGFETDRVGRLPVYYYPQLSVLGISLPLFNDNAAYAFTLDAFLIPPRLVLQDDVPLSANRGVIVHEYSHAVFNRIVSADRRAPLFLVENYPPRVQNEIRSLDEGLADLFAALAVGDPDFISSSISTELFDIDRDLTRVRRWDTATQAEALESLEALVPNPYLLGSVFASTLWATRDFLDDETLARTALAAMQRIESPPADFGAVDFFNAFLVEVPTDHVRSTCDLFVDRLPIVSDELDCP